MINYTRGLNWDLLCVCVRVCVCVGGGSMISNLLTNLSKSVLVSTSPLLRHIMMLIRQHDYCTGVP